MMRSFLKLSVAYVVSVFVVLPARPQELTVAAAADLRPALEEISAGFEKTSRVSVRIVYGSSGSFYEQIENGAPFDFFLSANADYPQRLESAGLALANSYYEYAQGKLVLLTRMDSKLDLQKGLQVLLDPAVKKIAIADPNHAPYGQAAVAALKTEGLYERISAKIVTGENVSQATSYVSSGAAEVGLVAMSLALAPAVRSQVHYAQVSARDYPPIRQGCIVVRSSKNQKSAMQLEEYLRGEKAKDVLRRFGFEVPGANSGK